METLTLFLCVSAAVVLTNGLILFGVARYAMKRLESISRAESDRLAKMQEQGTAAIKSLTGALTQTRRSRFSGFDNDDEGRGSA
jgi:hypothetical protein